MEPGPSGAVVTALEPEEPIQPFRPSALNFRTPEFVDVDLSGVHKTRSNGSRSSEGFFQAPGPLADYYGGVEPIKTYGAVGYPGLAATPTALIPKLRKHDPYRYEDEGTLDSRESIISRGDSDDDYYGNGRRKKRNSSLLWLLTLIPIILLVLAGIGVGVYFAVRSTSSCESCYDPKQLSSSGWLPVA